MDADDVLSDLPSDSRIYVSVRRCDFVGSHAARARVEALVVRFLADPHTSARARARVFSDPLKFNRTMTYRPLGLLLPPGARLSCDEVWMYR